MEARTLRILEFDKVRQQIEEYTQCSLGRRRLAQLQPYSSASEANLELAAVDEMLQLIYRQGTLPYGGITDIESMVRKSVIGGVLSPADLNSVAEFISGGRRVRQVLDDAREKLSLVHLAESAEALFDARQTELLIRQAIDEDSSVRDDASPELRQLRTTRRQMEHRARQTIEQMVRTHARYLQDPIIAMRGNSLCLPVRVDAKGAIRGIVHDYSASGATVYIEPYEVVEANQRVKELLQGEEREIERILQRLSGVVAEVAEPLLVNIEVLGHLDAWMAKAQYAKREKCLRPTLSLEHQWYLRGARHPLIAADIAVPIDVELGRAHNMIIITGPNTGGKTVTLKTVGLLSLMAMSGCFIPTAFESTVGWCDEIFVDIGDEQSIEQSLSTFSSHMKNIVHILGMVTADTLVLLDELGAGTDPTEGAALAIAILDYLKGWNCRVVATTHYAELKAYAFSEPTAVNASVEFDVDTLRPTYRLLVGVPGRSNAIAIASRLGLSDRIIEQAKGAMLTTDLRVEDMIRQIEDARRTSEEAAEQATRYKAETEDLKKLYEMKIANIELASERLLQDAEVKAKAVIEKAQSEAERVIQELRRNRQEMTLKDHELLALRKSLESALPADSRPKGRKGKAGIAAVAVTVGSVVRVLSLGQKGEVIEVSDDGQAVTVQLGLLKMKVNASDLEVLQEAKQPKASPTIRRGLPKDMRLEIDVRGEMVEDALAAVDKYLDDAVVNALPRVAIIHGKGTGALRNAVRRHLSSHPQVQSYVPGGAGEGGDGVTIVTLQK